MHADGQRGLAVPGHGGAGRSYCQKHYIEQKRRNERKRERKLHRGRAAPIGSPDAAGVRRPGGDSKKRKCTGSEGEDLRAVRKEGRIGGRKKGKKQSGGRGDAIMEEEEVSDNGEHGKGPSSYFMEKGVLGFEEEDDEEAADPGERLKDSGKKARGSGREARDLCRSKGNAGEGAIERPCVGRRSSLNRKRKDFGSAGVNSECSVSFYF